MKILITPDSFKGSATATEVAKHIAKGIRSVNNEIEVAEMPMGDGGEGTAAALATALGNFDRIISNSQNANRKPFKAEWFFNSTRKIAIIDMASASGITHIPKNELNILGANTFGTGLLINEAIKLGANEIIIGLGGSATTDAGIGMAAALGFGYLDKNGKEVLPIPLNFMQIEKVISPELIQLTKITGIYDVSIPLLGANGTVAKYSTQKGAGPKERKFIENGLEYLVKVVDSQHENEKGAGAAGGLGYGLCSFLNAQLKPGFEFVSKTLNIENEIASADLIITGEGQVDIQTLDGKLVRGIADFAHKSKKPLIVVAGQIHNPLALQEQLNAAEWISLAAMCQSPQQAMLQCKTLLEQVGARVAHKYLNE